MDCPWCGSTVEICGDSWECGWCGDFGWCVDIESLQGTPTKKSANTAEITLTLSLVYHVDLPETWNDLKKALDQIAPKNALLSQLLGKVLLHNISNGIQHAGALPDEKKAEELRTFLHTTADLNLGESAEEIMRDAKQGILFREEAALSENECGTFWAELLSTRPVEDYYNQIDPDGLFELFSELSSAYAYFGGKKDEEGEAQDYQNALEKAYNAHWQDKVLLHPDIERAKRLLAQGKFLDYGDICRDILLVEYPEEVPHETAGDVNDLSWKYILDDVFASNTAKGIQMWRRLLDIAEPSLKTDPKTAGKLLSDWDWLSSPNTDQVHPLLTALDDERFVSQIFESASIGRLQFTIIGVCRSSGQEKLCQHLLQLALENPNLEENRKKQFRRAFSAEPYFTNAALRSYAAGKPSAYTKTDDGTVYHYCSVWVQGTQRPYAYMTGGLPLKVGDWVELPFGEDDALRRGQVKAVMDCTRMAAPWPPERTKTVIRTIDAPAATPTIEVAVPKPQKRVEQPKKETEKVEVPVISVPVIETKQPEAEPQVTEPVVSEKDEKRPVPPKKPFQLGKLIAAVLAVAVIAGISISVSNRNKQRAAAYDAALQEMSNGNYTSAERDFSALSGYRDAASLSVYCKYADMYKDRTDYVGGQDELSNITLQYDTGWQQDVDALETRVKEYKVEQDAAMEAEWQRIEAENAAKREQSLKDQYSGKLPVEGMPVSGLKYTSLGEPDKEEKCRDYDRLVEERRSISIWWYGSDGKILAAGTCFKHKGDSEFMLYSFSYYDPTISASANKGRTFNYGNGSDYSGSLRDEYDSPEDLWEENRDWYEDEDEAWDEWYDD